MKLKNSLISIVALSFVLGWTTACQTSIQSNNTVVNSSTNNSTQINTNKTEANKTEANKTEAKKPETDEPSTASLSTPADAYKAAYNARQKKDLPGLKRALSKKALEFFTTMGKTENKTLEDELTELTDRPQASTAETRNEKITGDKAELEYLDERGNWSRMDFVKEGSDWKLTIPDAK